MFGVELMVEMEEGQDAEGSGIVGSMDGYKMERNAQSNTQAMYVYTCK